MERISLEIAHKITKPIIHEVRAIPVPELLRVIDILPYASTERIMFEMLFFTGCRISELSHMNPNRLMHEDDGYYIYWRLGKNQDKMFRKTKLPEAYVKELREYRNNNKVMGGKLFSPKPNSFARMFNRYREQLGGNWNKKGYTLRSGAVVEEFVYQLKGIRKTFQTWLFYKYYREWNDSQVALLMTSKEMKHSCLQMTAHHYIRNFEELNINEYALLTPEKAYEKGLDQKNLLQFQV